MDKWKDHPFFNSGAKSAEEWIDWIDARGAGLIAERMFATTDRQSDIDAELDFLAKRRAEVVEILEDDSLPPGARFRE